MDIRLYEHAKRRFKTFTWNIHDSYLYYYLSHGDDEVRKHIPLEFVKMGSEVSEGYSEILHPVLQKFISRYRFFFNPVGCTSFALALCEAMIIGMPVISMATMEYASVIQSGVHSFISNNVEVLIKKMKLLLQDHLFAKKLGHNRRKTPVGQFNIHRFTNEWENLFDLAINKTAYL